MESKSGSKEHGGNERDGNWVKGWEPFKYSPDFCHPTRNEVTPWCIDSFYLSSVLLLDVVIRVTPEFQASFVDEMIALLRTPDLSKAEYSANLLTFADTLHREAKKL